MIIDVNFLSSGTSKKVEVSDEETVKVFNNWKEVSDWWSANPKAYRVYPKIEANTITDYNKENDNLEFPCEMRFVFPV